MFSSEQTFTINGDNNQALEKVLQLALDLDGWKGIKAFYKDVNGLVLLDITKIEELQLNLLKEIVVIFKKWFIAMQL